MPSTNAAPTWEWEGSYDCVVCGETFGFSREAEFPKGWVLQVYHDHSEYEPGIWRAALYQQWKGRRKPSIVKDQREQAKQAYKDGVERRQIENASK